MAVDSNDKSTLLLLAIQAQLQTVALLATVELGRIEHLKVPRPATAIIPVMNEEKRASKTHNVTDFDILLRTVADEEDQHAGLMLSQAVFAIKEAMKNGGDRTWGGLAIDTLPGATHWLYVDKDLPRAGADIEYRFHIQLA
jgi:hypothetical protein